MILSDVSIRRPVVALVASILVVLIGLLSFAKLPVREYPLIDSPVVSVETSYRGASAEVVEAKITEPLEKEIASIDGIRVIRSSSQEESSRITVEFGLSRSVDEAANDVRDRVSRARGRLPDEINEPVITKADADSSPVITLAFNSERYSRLELVELVERIAIQRLQTIPGVGTVGVRGPRYAMRLWVDSDRLAAHQLTVGDVENALRQQNVEIPGGRIESSSREFPVRIEGRMTQVAEFENLVLATRGNYQVKFSDVGRVELGAEEYRSEAYFKGRPTVGVQVLRQAQANVLDVAAGVKKMIPLIKADLPDGINVDIGFDSSVFVDRSVREVYKTLWEASVLVVLMIFLFLRDWRATMVPLVAIPVSIIGSFAVMSWMGFTINTLTLLALVLAVGLVVDDAIVMLENIYRRIEEGEGPIHAAIFGARQVAFAVIATTLTLAAVFLPVAFQSGQTGRLFFEFGITLAVSVLVSAFVALTLTPMLCSRVLRPKIVDGQAQHGWFYQKTEPFFVRLNGLFERTLRGAFRVQPLVLLGALLFTAGGMALYTQLQRELTPLEDRGIFTANLIAPIGATPEYLRLYSVDMEQMILKIPEIDRTFHRTGDGGRAFVFATLKPWEERERKTQEIVAELRRNFQREVTGGQAVANPVRPFGGGPRGGAGGVQLVLLGSDFDELQRLGGEYLKAMRESGQFIQPRVDPSPTKPQLDVKIDRAKAADLKVPISAIASTLESLLGGRRVTEFQRGNQQYYAIVQVTDENRATPSDLSRLYVRSTDGVLVQLSNVVSWSENTVPESYPHFNRLRSVTVSAQMSEGRTIGDGVAFLNSLSETTLPAGYTYAWDGETREFVESGNDTLILFGLALLFTFLILAAQFESWIHPVTIFTGVFIAVAGGLLVLYATRYWGVAMTDNLFSRFGLIMLIGLVAKNGILIVEFANQLQVEKGEDAMTAAFEAATIRFRPILMTSISTVLGAVPIAFASGAGAETRNPMGIVVVGGLTLSTLITLYVIPIVYVLMDRLCVRFTGHSSAHGLKKAAEIERETESLPATAH
ncbi:Efflux pump membrane transporter BepE [Lacunisphaera limnophila]|uniref:Efflux pump membrane transporter BepE n=1 Tax=Lacunisphaera limnophila TaxID=1838286 RepID=A0A1D8AXG7_9BACT|nr:efflux RND transporter permease subunit [Lacunisphaera limnophila]AOS45582.1 Efflux pump membrane transporter BepE [Lacunisphaera limnophila]